MVALTRVAPASSSGNNGCNNLIDYLCPETTGMEVTDEGASFAGPDLGVSIRAVAQLSDRGRAQDGQRIAEFDRVMNLTPPPSHST